MNKRQRRTRIFVTVTEHHIKYGKRRCTQNCAIAKAVKVLFPHLHVEVYGTGGIRVGQDSYFPFDAERMLTFQLDFDKGKPVKPFTFSIYKEYR